MAGVYLMLDISSGHHLLISNIKSTIGGNIPASALHGKGGVVRLPTSSALLSRRMRDAYGNIHLG